MTGAIRLKNDIRRLAALAVTVALAAGAHAAGDSPLIDPIDDSLDRQPIQTVIPGYPKLAQRERLEGEVQVCFHIRASGRTQNVRVRRSTNRIFEKPAVQAVRRSTYAPLEPGEKPSPVKSCRTFRFFLSPVAIETP